MSSFKYALGKLPKSTRLYKALKTVFELHGNGCDAEEAKTIILKELSHHNFTDCVMNLSFILYSLLWGKGDFIKTVLLAINCGRDTDCTAATCGAVLGICHGSKVIPASLLKKLSPKLTLSEHIGRIEGVPKTLPELIDRTVALREKLAEKLPETLYPLYRPYASSKPMAYDRARWLVLDNAKHDISAIKEELLRTRSCPQKLKQYIFTTDGLFFNLSKFAKCANTLNLFTFLTVDNPGVDRKTVILSATADVGMTLWLDRLKLLNHHSRQLSLPSFHRAEGGAAFHYPLRHGDSKLVHIKLYSCLPPLKCTLMFGNSFNDHLDGFNLSI